MRTTSYRSYPVLILFAVLLTVIFFAPLKAANIITSLDFQISPADQTAKIGDYILFNMAVIDSTATYSNVIVLTETAGSIDVTSPDFPAGYGNMFVYDGTHTWLFSTGFYSTSPPNTLTLDNTHLIAGQNIASYLTLQYAVFSAAQGSLSPGGSATVDIGTAISGIPLYDDGDMANHNDLGSNDGIYNGKFLIRDNYSFNIQNGSITGEFVKSGLQAANAPFTAPAKIWIDGVRPKISLVNATPNPYNPNKELEQFFYSLSENSTVALTIYQGATTVKTLTASGNFGFNPPILWDGLNDNGVLQADGDYSYRFDMTDAAGNTGVPFIGILKLTTVTLTTSLYTFDTQFIHTSQNQVMVTVKMHAELNNATMPNMQNLGFNYPEAGVTHDFHNYPYLYIDLRLYDPAGTLMVPVVRDRAVQFDADIFYMDTRSPTFADGWPMTGFPYTPMPINGCSINPANMYTIGDGDKTNDWDNVFQDTFTDIGGGKFTEDPSFMYYSNTIVPGTYIVYYRGVLVGKSVAAVKVPATFSADCMVGTTTVSVSYMAIAYHAMPSYFYDETVGLIGDIRGYGLASDDNTVSYIVEQDPNISLPDTTPPYIVNLSAVPSDGKILQPSVISPTNYIQVQIKDDGVGAGPINLSTIVLLDPNGNPVPGHVAWNGGVAGTKTWSVYFIPDAPIIVGGSYTYTVTPVDAANNHGAAVVFHFTVTDTAIPVVQSVMVQSGSGSTLELSKSIATQVTFLVSKIEATINPGGTSLVNWATSSISVSGVAGTSSHTDGTNTVDFTPSGVMADGRYTVSIYSVSQNGASGISTYTFYITTAAVTYVDISGSGDNNRTCLRISSFTALQSGVSDGTPVDIPPADLNSNSLTVSTVTVPPAPPSGYSILSGSAISFTVSAPYVFPLNFNTTLCASNLRMHYTDANVSTLTSNGLTTADITLWVYESSWTKITMAFKIVNNGTDHYLDLPIATIPAGNRYALMYQPPVIPPVAYKFNNTKAFNPTSGPAKIYYSDTIADIASMKVYIYNISGTLVRTLDFSDAAEHVFFTGNDLDPANSFIVRYYISWDGKNDKGSFVRNGIYIFKYKLTRTTGASVSNTRMIAVVK